MDRVRDVRDEWSAGRGRPWDRYGERVGAYGPFLLSFWDKSDR